MCARAGSRTEDLELLKKLHNHVPVLILLAKSDTLTKQEREQFGLKVDHYLKKENINTFQFSSRKLGMLQLDTNIGGTNTWAVFCSKSGEREYPWGTAKVDDFHHNELGPLRKLLLEMGGWHECKKKAMQMADADKRKWFFFYLF